MLCLLPLFVFVCVGKMGVVEKVAVYPVPSPLYLLLRQQKLTASLLSKANRVSGDASVVVGKEVASPLHPSFKEMWLIPPPPSPLPAGANCPSGNAPVNIEDERPLCSLSLSWKSRGGLYPPPPPPSVSTMYVKPLSPHSTFGKHTSWAVRRFAPIFLLSLLASANRH